MLCIYIAFGSFSGIFLEISLGGPLGTPGVAGPEVRARNVGVEHDLSEFPPVDDRSGSPKKIAPGISGKVKFSRILQIAFIYKRFWRGISVALAEDSGSRSGRGQLGAGNGAGGGGSKRAIVGKKRWRRARFVNFLRFLISGFWVPKGSQKKILLGASK